MLRSENNNPIRCIDGRVCVRYDGYWIRYYAPPKESLATKVELVRQLTRRAFHHSEPGINTPGTNLESARQAYLLQSDPALKRVNASMLAGALLNRVSDTLTLLVQLERKGVTIEPSNDVLKRCEEQLREAMQLGSQTRHISGLSNVSELWGEPLHAFCLPVEDFYDSRYRKIAITLRYIEEIKMAITDMCRNNLRDLGQFSKLIESYAAAAILMTETMKSDPDFFNVWPLFVAAQDSFTKALEQFPQSMGERYQPMLVAMKKARDLIGWMASLRVPMEKPTGELKKMLKEVSKPS